MIATVDTGITQALHARLTAAREDEGDLPTAAGTRLRGSWSLVCLRRLAMHDAGVPEDYPIDGSSLATFEVGHIWHQVIQQAIADVHGGELEVAVDLTGKGWPCSTHADVIYGPPTTAVEIKSKGSFGFGKATTGQGKWGAIKYDGMQASPGPDPADICQAAKSGIGVDAERIHIVYANKDRTGDALAEWVFGMDEPLGHVVGAPSPRRLAEDDLTLQVAALEQVDAGVLPARYLPGYGIVESPPKHHTEGGKGNPWQCRYCPFNGKCPKLPSGEVPLDLSVAS